MSRLDGSPGYSVIGGADCWLFPGETLIGPIRPLNWTVSELFVTLINSARTSTFTGALISSSTGSAHVLWFGSTLNTKGPNRGPVGSLSIVMRMRLTAALAEGVTAYVARNGRRARFSPGL